MDYPTNTLRLDGSEFTDYSDDLFLLADLTEVPGAATVSLIAADPIPAADGNGSFIQLTFEILSGTPPGEVIDLNLSGIEFTDADGNPLSVSIENGMITVESPVKPGDVDGNDRITLVDALFTLQAALGKRDLSDTQFLAADVDESGRLTLVDALFILQAALGKRDLSAKAIAGATRGGQPVALTGSFEDSNNLEVSLVVGVTELAAGAMDVDFRYDPEKLKWVGFEGAASEGAVVDAFSEESGVVRLARLGTLSGGPGPLGRLTFERLQSKEPTSR